MDLESIGMIVMIITTAAGLSTAYVKNKKVSKIINIIKNGATGTLVYEKAVSTSSDGGTSWTDSEKIQFADAWIPVVKDIHELLEIQIEN
jgi:hypothetical protein